MPDGLTQFICRARDCLTEACDGIQFEMRGESEYYLCGTVPETDVIIFLYSEGAEIYKGSKVMFWAEHHDYETPDYLIGSLVPAAIEAVAAAKRERVMVAY